MSSLGKNSLPDLWLIRTHENQIAGPYPRNQIIELIEQGKLTLHDEVCRANSYWFGLYEDDEVRSQLGLELQFESEDEITETETLIPTPTAISRIQGVHPKLGETRKTTHTPKIYQPQVLGQIERTSIWKGVAWLLLTLSVVLVYAVLRILRS